MADAAVEPARNPLRFFCHSCNVEFEDVIQNDTCPYCATGFIEQLDNDERESLLRSQERGEYSDAEMSTLDDAGGTDDSILDESIEGSNTNILAPVLNDLAFLMSGGRPSSTGQGAPQPGRQDTLMEQLVWMIGGGRIAGATVAAGTPFVLVGAPGDYVFGGDGLDAVVTQLLGQLENTGPAPLSTEQITAIPTEEITASQIEANMSCSVCWDTFNLGDTVSRLECSHIFHPACITPWLQLHATCPICRRSLLPPAPAAPAPAPAAAPAAPGAPAAPAAPASSATPSTPAISRVVVRRIGPRRRVGGSGGASAESSSTASSTSISGLWAQITSSFSSLANADTSSSSLNSSDRYMDIDYD